MKKDLQVKVVMMILVGVYANHMSLEPDVIGVTTDTMDGLIASVSCFFLSFVLKANYDLVNVLSLYSLKKHNLWKPSL